LEPRQIQPLRGGGADSLSSPPPTNIGSWKLPNTTWSAQACRASGPNTRLHLSSPMSRSGAATCRCRCPDRSEVIHALVPCCPSAPPLTATLRVVLATAQLNLHALASAGSRSLNWVLRVSRQSSPRPRPQLSRALCRDDRDSVVGRRGASGGCSTKAVRSHFGMGHPLACELVDRAPHASDDVGATARGGVIVMRRLRSARLGDHELTLWPS
jgi:hypothetical protein